MTLLSSIATAVYNIIEPRKLDLEYSRSINHEVSAIIPVYNEAENIKDTVVYILCQSYPVKNIYLLDDNSNDGTFEICQSLNMRSNIHHIRNKTNKGKGKNIDTLVKEEYDNLGDILWVVDSDIRTHPDQLKKLLDYFDSDDVGAVSGRCFPMPPEKGLQAKLLYNGRTRAYNVNAFEKKWQMRRDAMYVLVGANFAIKKDVFDKLGGMPARVLTEDLDLCWMLQEEGYKVRVATEVKSQSRIPQDIRQYYKQIYRWNKGSLQALWTHKTDLKKSPSLAITTLLPGYGTAYIAAAYRLSLPVVTAIDPAVGISMLALDVIQSTIFTAALSPKNLGQFISYNIHGYTSSLSWVHAALSVGKDIVTRNTDKWAKKGWSRAKLSGSA